MKRINFLVLSLVLSATAIFAQEGAVITVDEKVYNFGKVAEETGNISHEFIVKNTGDAPLVISRVTASCGCTTPDWTKSPIAPGSTGIVKATYGAKGRPGSFAKTITVYSNAKDGGILVLTIKGEVIPKAQSPEAAYPAELGDLRLKTTELAFGNLTTTEVRTQNIEIYNQGAYPLHLTFANIPKYISASISPATIPAKSSGEIAITYDGAKVKRHGTINNKLELSVHGIKNTTHQINVSTTVVDDFSKLSTEETTKSPIVYLASNSIVFDKASIGKSKDLVIKNNGKRDLIIYNVATSDNFVLIQDTKKTAKPGGSCSYKISVDPKKATAKKSTLIELATNDPSNPIKKLRVTVNPE
jgi:hypothetical protein